LNPAHKSLRLTGQAPQNVPQRFPVGPALRLKLPRDNGMLYRCCGPQVAFWNVWMNSLECQVQEQDTGDFYGLGGMAEVTC